MSIRTLFPSSGSSRRRMPFAHFLLMTVKWCDVMSSLSLHPGRSMYILLTFLKAQNINMLGDYCEFYLAEILFACRIQLRKLWIMGLSKFSYDIIEGKLWNPASRGLLLVSLSLEFFVPLIISCRNSSCCGVHQNFVGSRWCPVCPKQLIALTAPFPSVVTAKCAVQCETFFLVPRVLFPPFLS